MLDFLKRRDRGVRLDTKTYLAEDNPIEDASMAEYLYFPLTMHIGAPAQPIVEIGDKVKIGTVLAEADGPISANIISSVSGHVHGIEDQPTTNGLEECIIVKNDFQDTKEDPIIEPGSREDLSAKEKVDAIVKAGIVGMGGATFPTGAKLDVDDKIDTVIINGAECEPFSTADYRLMVENSFEIAKAMEYIKEIYPGSKAYIGIEKQDSKCVESMKEALKDYDGSDVYVLENLFPQGEESFLIENVTGREVPPGGLPADVGCMVINVGTSFAIYELLEYGKPLIERITTVSGHPLNEKKNLKVRIGTPINYLFQDCGGFKLSPKMVLEGGPMMGNPINSGHIPVTKGTSCISVMDYDYCEHNARYNCIRCAECINVCPMNLQPIQISNAYERDEIEKTKELGALDCVNCGNCSYICPSNLPLLDNIKAAGYKIEELEEEG